MKLRIPSTAHVWKCPRCEKILAAYQGEKTQRQKAHDKVCKGAKKK